MTREFAEVFGERKCGGWVGCSILYMKLTPAVLSSALCLLCAMQAVPVTANAAAPALFSQEETPGPLAPPQPPAQQPISIPPGAAGPKLIGGQGPIYPPEAKAQHLAGVVKLHAIIDTDGNVTELTLISSTDPIFVDAAMAAVRRWKYIPYAVNGVPVTVQTNITVNFSFGK